MRQEYEMSQEDLDEILGKIKDASGPLIMLQCGPGRSVQEVANDAWAALGKKMGFRHMTAQPVSGKSNRFFTAEPVV